MMTEALRSAYAVVSLPAAVQQDMRETCFLYATTAKPGLDHHLDPYASMFNEGMRYAWLTFEGRIHDARHMQPARQEKAVSSTVDEAM